MTLAQKLSTFFTKGVHLLLADAPVARFFQLAILCGGFAGTLILHHIFSDIERQKEETTFEEDVSNRIEAIQAEVNTLAESLLSLGRSVQLLPELTHQQFRFIADPMKEQLNSVSIIGWVPRILVDQKRTFEEKAKRELFSGFTIKPIPGYQNEKGNEVTYYYPILYAVPQADQARVSGYDEATVPAILKAIDEALLTHTLVVSDPFLFSLFSDNQLTAWLYPVEFSSDKAPAKTVAGFVQYVMDIGKLVDVAIQKVVEKNIDVIVTIGKNSGEGQVLYQYHSQTHSRKALLDIKIPPQKKLTYTLHIGQKAWKLQFIALPSYFEYSYLPYFIIFGGSIITLLLAIFLKFIFHIEKQYHIQEELETQVKERTDELKKTFEQLQITQKQMIAQEKLASLGTVASGLAHEVQNPLNFILNFSELSVELIDEITQFFNRGLENITKKEAGDIQADLLDLNANIGKIHSHGKRINNIVNRIQEYGKQTEKEFSEIQLPHLINETLDILTHQMAEQYPSFKVEVTKDFSPSVQNVMVIPTDIAQVLMHIFNNAFQALLEKQKRVGETFKPLLTVKLTKTGGNQFSIMIRDNGIGIKEEHVKKIFTPLFTTKATGEGSGLGLSTSYTIVTDEHHGEMSFRSQENEFTEFTIILPISPE